MLFPSSCPRFSNRFSLKARGWAWALGAVLAFSDTGMAQTTLQWGIGGAGGSDTWNTTTANWWNGTAQVPWAAGGVAVFGGTAGTVTIGAEVQASKLIFATPGYAVQSSTLRGAPGGLTLEMQADGAISSTLSGTSGSGGNLTKMGAGRLTLTGNAPGFFDQIVVAEGELELYSNTTPTASFVLANSAGATLTIGGSVTFIPGLSGGGSLGGIVRPGAASSKTIFVLEDGTFGGVLMDNGSAILSFSVDSFTTQTLTGVNTHTGTTESFGTVVLSAGGRLVNSSPSIPGTLRLENDSTALANRLSDTAPVSLSGGNLVLNGHATTPISEVVGALTVATRPGTVMVNQPGAAVTEVVFNGLSRTTFGTVVFEGTGVTRIENVVQTNGFLGGWATIGNDWARLDEANRVVPFSAYSSDLATPNLSAHTKATASAALSGDIQRLSLNFANAAAGEAQLDLAGHVLTLETGALMSSGAGPSSITGGTLSVGATAGHELIVTTRTDLSLAANIVETTPGLALTKVGAGVLTLRGTNQFSGDLNIHAGVLAIENPASLGQAGTVRINGATLRTLSGFASGATFAFSGTPSSGSPTIDTQGFDVTLSGTTTGSFRKIGAGELILSSPRTSGATVEEGRLVFTATGGSGNVTLSGGELDVTGDLGSFVVPFGSSGGGLLQIGEDEAATLTLRLSVREPLTIEFDLGSAESDLLKVRPNPLVTGNGQLNFRFQDLGGVTTGVPYPLMEIMGSFIISASDISIAPESLAAGWAGFFSSSFVFQETTVAITFTSVPEPSTAALLLAAGCGWLGFRRNRRVPRPGL